jgi:hypothetical protein
MVGKLKRQRNKQQAVVWEEAVEPRRHGDTEQKDHGDGLFGFLSTLRLQASEQEASGVGGRLLGEYCFCTAGNGKHEGVFETIIVQVECGKPREAELDHRPPTAAVGLWAGIGRRRARSDSRGF